MGPTRADPPPGAAPLSAGLGRESREPRRIAFLGLGLIGGSLAMALRAATTREPSGSAPELVAWTPRGGGPRVALARGIIDHAAPSAEAAIEGSDLVVLAGPPLAALDHLASLAGSWRGVLGSETVVTDVTSTKGAVVARADELAVRFVGGHPMAGRESTGIEAATADLFVDRPWVVVPGRCATDRDLVLVERLAARVEARPVRMTAQAHDAAVAAISHLPLLVAASLVEAMADGADWSVARSLAATGWRDTTRLARGDPDMGAGILATNSDAVAARLRDLRSAIDRWLAMLQPPAATGPDPAALRARLAAARAALGAGQDPGE